MGVGLNGEMNEEKLAPQMLSVEVRGNGEVMSQCGML
jgi:hypothetical protein